MHWLKHKWGEWSAPYELAANNNGERIWNQHRKCVKCGFIRQRYIGDVPKTEITVQP